MATKKVRYIEIPWSTDKYDVYPDNNVTGSGTSGYLTKWNGANSITNGPQLGSDTTTFLRNDGTWAIPANTDTLVKQTLGSTDATYPLLASAQSSPTSGTAYETIYDTVGIKINPNKHSVAEGISFAASGMYSHSEGQGTEASGYASHAEGILAVAAGDGSHAEGGVTAIDAMLSLEVYETDNSYGEYYDYYLFLDTTDSIEDGWEESGVIAGYRNGILVPITRLLDTEYVDEYSADFFNVKDPQALRNYLNDVTNTVYLIYGNLASGNFSHAEGSITSTTGYASHAEGFGTMAAGDYSHAEGGDTIVTDNGMYAHAEGYETKVSNNYAHAEGRNTAANGTASHAEGNYTIAKGSTSHAEGYYTRAVGSYSHAEGYMTTVLGNQSHISGKSDNLASSSYTTSTPNDTIVSASQSNRFSLIKGDSSHLEGENNLSLGSIQHVEGRLNVAVGACVHMEGSKNTSLEGNNHTEGECNLNYHSGTHAEGSYNFNGRYHSHTEGTGNYISLDGSESNGGQHVEGLYNKASGPGSHVEGGIATQVTISSSLSYTKVSDILFTFNYTSSLDYGRITAVDIWHGSGNWDFRHYYVSSITKSSNTYTVTLISGAFYHIISSSSKIRLYLYSNEASGLASHAEGVGVVASGSYSHAGGYNTIADQEAMTAIGKYNKAAITNSIYALGVGTSDSARKNAHLVLSDGKHYIPGIGGYDGTLTSFLSISDLASVINGKVSAYQLNSYLSLGGGTMSGTIKRTYSSASTPFAHIISGNYDANIWRVGYSDYSKMSADYGFTLQYVGSGSDVNNRLRLYADNQAGTQVTAVSINQSGQVGIGTDSNTNYRAVVDGSTNVSNGFLSVTNNGNTITIGSQNSAYGHFYNSTNVPFYFSQGLDVNGDVKPYGTGKNLGNNSQIWETTHTKQCIVQNDANNKCTMSYDSTEECMKFTFN